MADRGVVAGYYRLSVEDSIMKEESNSITNQRLLIKRFVGGHEELSRFEFVEFYDDGYSGTNMERPGMQGLLAKIKEQEIDCVVVKDFSRFSRDYIELGSYMQQIFPFMGIRFLSVTDHYDSNDYVGRTADIDVDFKNLLADFYCKDISKKVKSSMMARKNQGKYSTGSVPFGYCKNQMNKLELIPVPEEAKVVKRIYELCLSGLNTSQICKTLNDDEIMTPLEFISSRKPMKRKELAFGRRYWQPVTVRNILTNESYIGNMVYNKSEQAAVGSSRTVVKPRKEWKVFENHHEAIVSQEMFEQVQGSFFKRNNTVRGTVSCALKGKMYCGGCQRKLRISKIAAGRMVHYCPNAKSASICDCYSKRMDNEELEAIVLKHIKLQLKELTQMEEVWKQQQVKRLEKLTVLKKHLNKQKVLVEEIKNEKINLLEAYHEGKLSRDAFKNKKQAVDVHLVTKRDEIKELETSIIGQENAGKAERNSYEELLHYTGFDTMNKEMAEAFVEAIYLYDHTIEIHWTFCDSVATM